MSYLDANAFQFSIEGVGYLDKGAPATHVVSIDDFNPLARCHVEGTVATLKLNFDDTRRSYTGAVNQPQPSCLNRLDEFLDPLLTSDDTTVLFHCTAGISRSAACALYLLLTLYDGDIKLACEKLLQIRPQASPNPVIVKFIDDRLALRGKLLSYIDINERRLMIPGLSEDWK